MKLNDDVAIGIFLLFCFILGSIVAFVTGWVWWFPILGVGLPVVCVVISAILFYRMITKL